jgi:hypothetical protein
MRKTFLLAALLVPALAWAAPQTAAEWFKEGSNQYNLGNFDRAVEAFKRAFELEGDENKQAVYVYNIAQAYRLANDCAKAHFFYKRFLALKSKPNVKPLTPEERQKVEDFIRDLDECAQRTQKLSKQPPENLKDANDGSDKPADPRKDARPPVATAAPGDTAPVRDEIEAHPVVRTAPSVISLRIAGGGTKINAGKLDVPVQFTGALVGGYPVSLGDQLTIDIGAAFTFTPVPFKEMNMVPAKTAQMYGVMVNGGLTYAVLPQLGARVDVGLGALLLSNAGQTSFVADGATTTGALSMFHLRTALSADYAVTPNVILTATPVAFTYSPPKDGLSEQIKSITTFDFMVGIGYRM